MTPHDESTIADLNVERLLSKAYQPEAPSPDLLRRVEERMCAAARSGPKVIESPDQTRLTQIRQRLAAVMAVAGMAAAVFLAIYAWQPRSPSDGPSDKSSNGQEFAQPREILKAKARAAGKSPEAVGVGREFRTEAGQRRRVALPDGSILYVNQNTRIKLNADRRVTLESGEVFVEVAPRHDTGEQFIVRTPQGAVTALGTKFAVRADPKGTGVVVTQGKVKVNEVELTTGQQLEPGRNERSTAPRASYVLDWTRELMAAAESPLVPDSKYTGGALIAKDPDGQEAKLTLRKYTVDVHIEDGFARTVIDQTYFNQNHWRMEGTFYFPLPPDASLSRLAMYVDGNLMEGGMAERDYARGVYEEIVYSQKDPALLEWVDGSTFKMRVFPLESRQEKRILIAYTQRLSSLYGRTQYRFPAGHSLGLVNHLQFRARVKNGDGIAWNCDSHKLDMRKEGTDLLLRADQRHAKLDRDVVLDLIDPLGAVPTGNAVRFSTALHEGNRYVMLRYRPRLTVQQQRQSRDWVFLFESSGDRDPLLARVQIDVIRSLLTNAEHSDTFAIVTAGTRVRAFADQPVLATPENIKAAIEFLEGSHLIGALDLQQALGRTESFLKAGPNPHLVHVGSGIAAMGERRPDVLARKIRAGTRYIGVGVGKRWSRDFMKTAAERTGGYFTQINPDEPVTWRAFELSATLNTPRLMDLKVSGDSRTPFLGFGTTLAQGEELCAVARFRADERLPQAVTVTGTLDGRVFEEQVPLPGDLAGQPAADYLPRTWAKLEIERLLAAGSQENKKEIVDLSKQMYVMTPFTSLLVLENEEMYKRFKVDRGRKDHWAMYQSPRKIPVVYEPEVGQPVDARFAPKTVKPHANQILATILVRVPAPILTWPNRQDPYGGQSIVSALQVYRGAFALTKGGGMGRDMVDVAAAEPPGLDDSPLPTNFNIDRINDVILAGVEKNLTNDEIGNNPDVNHATRGPRSAWRESLGNFGGRSRSLRQHVHHRTWAGAPLGDFQMMGGRFGNLGGQFGMMGGQFGMMGGMAGSPAPPSPERRSRIVSEEMEQQAFGVNSLLADRAMRRRSREELFVNESNAVESLKKAAGDGKGEGRRGDAADLFLLQLANGQLQGPRLYGQPVFTGQERVFTDLVGYAPGMTTSQADVQAVVEAEALPRAGSIPGKIDPEARRLIDAARTGGWQSLQTGTYTITFDGQGRYAYQRTLSSGLREQVICDGRTLWHLYPDLGIGARRSMSRFHRTFLTNLVPWLVPPSEDLARGADLKKIADRVVAIVPRGAEEARDLDGKRLPYHSMRLLFGDDGRLLERRIVRIAPQEEEKILFREVYDSAAGSAKLSAAKGKVLSKRQLKLTAAPAPSLSPETVNLVVLPLPYRTRNQVYQKAGVERRLLYDRDMGWTLAYLDADKALDLLAGEFAANDGYAIRQVYRRCFAANGVNKLGFFTLLASCGMNVASDRDFLALQGENLDNPLAGYLTVHNNRVYRHWHQRYGLYLGGDIGPKGSFFQRLSAFRDLFLRWQFNAPNQAWTSKRRFEEKRALDFVRENRSVYGWALLMAVQSRSNNSDFSRGIAEAFQVFDDSADLGYSARYERARSLLQAGDTDQAAVLFAELYDKRFADGLLPPIDHSFRQALLGDGKVDRWTALVRKTANALRKDNDRPALIHLAWQCWQLSDAPLAENLLAAALQAPKDNQERLDTTIAAIEYLMATNQLAEAENRIAPLLEDPAFNQRAMLWRVGSRIGQQRNLTAVWIHRLERALEIEYQNMPEMIHLQQVRNEYGQLLNHYEWLAGAVATMNIQPPADLLARTVRAADRWRALDRENAQPSEAAASVLRILGARDLAWDYLTTPIGMKPNEAQPWQGLASRLSYQGELDLANRAFKAAAEAEPTDAQILWQQAQNLRQAGKLAESRAVLRQIVERDWQPRFGWIKSQARWQLEGR